MICRVAALIGTASPRPMPATAVLMPTTRPRTSASAPPELPGLSAASVWITFSMVREAEPARAGERGARVAGVERRVGLDDVVEGGRGGGGAGRGRAAGGWESPCRHRSG